MIHWSHISENILMKEKLDRLKDLINSGFCVSEASKQIGVSHRTAWKWVRKNNIPAQSMRPKPRPYEAEDFFKTISEVAKKYKRKMYVVRNDFIKMGITPKREMTLKEQAIQLLTEGNSLEKIAALISCRYSSVCKWFRTPHVKDLDVKTWIKMNPRGTPKDMANHFKFSVRTAYYKYKKLIG